MVWFQCEDCGENLKKPKLQNHFRVCSANKLSCIDCGETFSQQSVQGHTQCISEAEKYGPKGQGKASNGTLAKPKNDSKQHSDIDINVGLSSRPPWFCSLCNTQATSKQTLLLHAEGKKHRAKARAFHAAKQQPSKPEESTPNPEESTPNEDSINGPKVESVEANGTKNVDEPKSSAVLSSESEKESQLKKKRKVSASVNGGVIQAERAEVEPQSLPKKSKHIDAIMQNEDQRDEVGYTKEPPIKKMKWKRLITSILKSKPDGVLKVKKLQKLVVKSLWESGITEDEAQLRVMLMHKINSSSRFILENKRISLAAKTGS